MLGAVGRAGGVALIYSILRNTFKSPDETNLLFHWSSDERKKKITQLETFKKNLVYEANELIENMNHTLFQELQCIRDSSLYDASQEVELEKWAAKYTKLEIPLLRREQSHDTKINEKLRTLSSQELATILTSNLPPQPHRSQSTNQRVHQVVEQFYRLEEEAIHRFTTQQLYVCDTMKSLRSKIISESKYRDHVAVLSSLAQLAVCQSFIVLTKRYLPPVNLVHLPSPPLSKFARFLLVIPICFVALSKPLTDAFVSSPPPAALPSSPITGPHLPPPQHPSPLPSQLKHIPHTRYAAMQPLPIYAPCTDRDDLFQPWSVFINLIVPPVIEGYIFRKLLFDSLLLSVSPLKAHLLVGIAATCASGLISDETSIYKVKHTHTDVAYDANNPPVETQHTFSVPALAGIIQVAQSIAGLYFSTALHIAVLISNRREHLLRSGDLLFSPLHSVLYDPLCWLSSSVDGALSAPLNAVMEFVDRTRHRNDDQNVSPEEVYKEIIKKYLTLQQEPGKEEAQTLSFEDALGLHFAVTDVLFEVAQKKKPMMPPKLADLKEMHRKGLMLRTSPLSHRQESGYISEIFPDDSAGASIKFLYDSYRSTAPTDFKYKEKDLFYLPRALLFDRSRLGQFKQRLFFWDETATEEDLLDLIQETNAHLLEKVLRSIDRYRSSRGAWLCLETQGQEEVSEDDLKEYYSGLEKYVLTLKEREEYLYTKLYSLSPSRFKKLIQRRGRELPAVLELSKSWDQYWESEEFKKKVRANGNPLRVYRPFLITADAGKGPEKGR
jgi:hypothetical protein